MKRYRVNLGRTTKPFSELVWADDAMVTDQHQLILTLDGRAVAIYRQGGWTRVRVVGQR
jgi:hypothetical protein